MARVAPTMHVAMLRGINVGGHHILPMQELRAIFATAGCTDVRTYIQSGNVILRAATSLASRLPTSIGAAILERFGFEVPIVVRSADELEAAIAACPFTVDPEDAKLLCVMFLADHPDAERVAALDPERAPGDRFIVHGREIYIRYATGAARSKLTNAYFDSTLGTVSTARNWRTATKLLSLARS